MVYFHEEKQKASSTANIPTDQEERCGACFSRVRFAKKSGKGLWSSFRSWCSMQTTSNEARHCQSIDLRDLLTAKERQG